MARVDTLGHFLTDVADAIREKGGTSEPIQASNFDTIIEALPSGGGSVEEKDVNFYDYDGTLTNSYTKAEFLNLTELPANPSHAELIAQGWNWTLSDAKTYVTSYDRLNIGQLYNTSDGALKIYVSLSDGRLDPYLSFVINGTATIDWGDNSATSSVTGSNTQVSAGHIYSNPGDYIISVSSESTIKITGSSNMSLLLTSYNRDNRTLAFLNSIKKVLCSNNTAVDMYGFNACRNLEYVVLPSNATTISQYTFKSCQNLRSIQVPTNVTSINSNAISNCTVLRNVSIPTNTKTFGSYAFEACRLLKSISIPDNSTFSSYTFNGCYSLTYVSGTIRTDYSNLFQYCYLLNPIKINSSVTYLGQNIFQQNYTFRKITIPSNITQINSNAFNECVALTAVIMPSNIASIGNNAFASCYGVRYYDFSNSTIIPSLGNTNSFSNMASDCSIIVPDDLYEEWITKQYWSNYSSHIIKKTDWDALQ